MAAPLLNTVADQFHPAAENGTPRRRRKSSGLSQDTCARDTGPSLGTAVATITSSSSSSATSSSSHARRPSEQANFSKSRNARVLLYRCKHFAIKHTWTTPLALLIASLALYAANPTESNIVHHFIFLSYKQQHLETDAYPSTPQQYGKGLWDIAFVSFYTIVLSFTREFIMQELLPPLARFCGIKSRGKQLRFMEQMYTAIYFALMGPAGIYVMRRTPAWYFNTRGMYEFYPHKSHEAVFKIYYLFQAAYWAQQAIVMLLGIEKRRKDFKELVAHHIVTLTLIALSYRSHFTYVGIAVYLTHDISDFFLATSKSLHYINSPLIGWSFGISIGAWIYLRHYLNLRIILSLFAEFQTVGPYGLDLETGQYKCLLSNVIFFGLLAGLQSLNIFWLFFLLRSAYRFVVHNIAKDDRSEAEESELEEMERTKEEVKNVEALPLLSGNGLANGSANGVIKATGSGTGAPPTKRTSDL